MDIYFKPSLLIGWFTLKNINCMSLSFMYSYKISLKHFPQNLTHVIFLFLMKTNKVTLLSYLFTMQWYMKLKQIH